MSYVRNWLHCVWGTKTRYPFLTHAVKPLLISHIHENAKTKGIYLDTLNGHTEHLHGLISLHPDQSLSKVMQLIKGESSRWLNKSQMTGFKFEWADEYFAVSVSESHVQRVRSYIISQEEHHRVKTWEEEYNEFMDKHGFVRMKG